MKSSAALVVFLGLVLSVRAASVIQFVEMATVTYNGTGASPTSPPTLTTPTTTMTSPTTTTTTTTTTTLSIPVGTTSYTTPAPQTPPSPSHIMCPEGWEVFEGRCYYFNMDDLTWPEAMSNCEMMGSILASVHSVQEYGFLQQLTTSNQNQNAWLGGFYLQNEWLWLDGSWFYNNSWGYSTSPAVSNPCLLLNSYEGWSNSQCNISGYPSICAKNSNVPSAVVCPQGWMGFQGRCYLYNEQGMSWADADTYCAGFGASLVSVHTLAEYNFLTKQSMGSNWLGGFYLENEWLWLDGSWFYQGFFQAMSPDNGSPCLSSYTANGWTNYPCADTLTSFCVKNEDL